MPRLVAPLDRTRTKLSPSDIAKICVLRFPQDGSEPLNLSAIGARFGVTGKAVGEVIRRFRGEYLPKSGVCQ